MSDIFTLDLLVSTGAVGAPVLAALAGVYRHFSSEMSQVKEAQERDRERTLASLHALQRNVDGLKTSITYSDRTMKNVEVSLAELAKAMTEFSQSQQILQITLTGVDGNEGMRKEIADLRQDVRDVNKRVSKVES